MRRLVAVGKGWMMGDFDHQLRVLGAEAKILMACYVYEKELIWFSQICYVNLFSLGFEGFGLPDFEGMQFGAFMLASNSTSIPEVSGWPLF